MFATATKATVTVISNQTLSLRSSHPSAGLTSFCSRAALAQRSLLGLASWLKLESFSASGRFAAQSKVFAVNMCSKISEMIRGYSTPLRSASSNLVGVRTVEFHGLFFMEKDKIYVVLFD